MNIPLLSLLSRSARDPRVQFLLRFALSFAVLQFLYILSEPNIPNFIRTELTARPVVWLIAHLTPQYSPSLEGISISHSSIGTILVGSGCEGLYSILLFTAAMLATPLSRVARAKSIILGASAIYAFNIARIVAIYYVIIAWPNQFELIHDYGGQILTIFVAVWMFYILYDRFTMPISLFVTRFFSWLLCLVFTMLVLFSSSRYVIGAVSYLPEAAVQWILEKQSDAVEKEVSQLPSVIAWKGPTSVERRPLLGTPTETGYMLTFGLPRVTVEAASPHSRQAWIHDEVRQVQFNTYPFNLLVLLTLPVLLVLPGFTIARRLAAAATHLALLGTMYGVKIFAAFLSEHFVLFRPLLDGWNALQWVASKTTLVMEMGGDSGCAFFSVIVCWLVFAVPASKDGNPVGGNPASGPSAPRWSFLGLRT